MKHITYTTKPYSHFTHSKCSCSYHFRIYKKNGQFLTSCQKRIDPIDMPTLFLMGVLEEDKGVHLTNVERIYSVI